MIALVVAEPESELAYSLAPVVSFRALTRFVKRHEIFQKCPQSSGEMPNFPLDRCGRRD